MTASTLTLILADAVLSLHVMIVLFVVLGLVLIVTGRLLAWSWVRNPWFRWVHFVCIGYVMLQAWAGLVCPLTTLEMWLRAQAGDTVYSGSFITYWLSEILYLDMPVWVFTVAYTVFGGLVALSLFWVKPDPFRRNRASHSI